MLCLSDEHMSKQAKTCVPHVGVRFICEPSLLAMPNSATQPSIDVLIAALSSTRQAAFHTLHDYQRIGNNPPTAEGIINSNLFGSCEGGSQTYIFLTASRFSHSCIPNCTFTWDVHQGIGYTCKDIGCGEELTISYINHHSMKWAARQAVIQKVWNLTCICQVGDSCMMHQGL